MLDSYIHKLVIGDGSLCEEAGPTIKMSLSWKSPQNTKDWIKRFIYTQVNNNNNNNNIWDQEEAWGGNSNETSQSIGSAREL